MEIRKRQMVESKETLKEYELNRRVSDVLSTLGHEVPSSSATIRRATDVYMDLWIRTLNMNQIVHTLLKELAGEYKLGLVTNFSHVPGANRTIDRFNLRPYFQTIVISGEFGWKKPSPRIFDAALRNLFSEPGETMFVGDDCEGDIAGAKQAGMRTVLIQRKQEECQVADFTIKSIAELPTTIRRL
jgi:putative hydrolase of the HAD superfamily